MVIQLTSLFVTVDRSKCMGGLNNTSSLSNSDLSQQQCIACMYICAKSVFGAVLERVWKVGAHVRESPVLDVFKMYLLYAAMLGYFSPINVENLKQFWHLSVYG